MNSFFDDFHEQHMLIGAVQSFSLKCMAVSNLNNRAAIWLNAEPKPAIQLQ